MTRFGGWLGIIAVGCMAACGGSSGTGSSGLISERSLVQRVLDTGSCEQLDGVDYCPTDTAGVSPGGETVDTPLDQTTMTGCFRSEATGAFCIFVLTFMPTGFEDGVEFVIATRPADSDGPWTLTSVRDPFFGEDVAEDEEQLVTSEVIVDLTDETGEATQLAILSFTTFADSQPTTVEQLSTLGADVVFVAPPLETIPEGFDEDRVIDDVRATETCEAAGVALFCPVDVLFEGGTPAPAFGPVPFPVPSQLTAGPVSPLTCRSELEGAVCIAEVSFMVLGDIGFFYRPAIRLRGSDGPESWQLGLEVEEADVIFVDEVRAFSSLVVVDLAGLELESAIAFDYAIVVDALDPADFPTEIQELNEGLPFYVFVSEEGQLTVE